ncbi:phosphotransferase [Natronorubrum daqingense]|nr:phosphotransferase [Natronorubrum daqingense]APX96590.1 hypothetical protein BB347_08150 [Natronorubrum daqingense]
MDVTLREGIPSTIDFETEETDVDDLEALATVQADTLDEVLARVRDDYMDGSIVDRFFKTRTACWRVLVSSVLSGRGLVVGTHDESVGILLSEVVEELYAVDTSVPRLRAQQAVANATGTTVNPVHSDLEELSFPPKSFDVIVVQCRANQIDEYLEQLEPILAEDGSLLVLTDGWTREIGLTERLGLGDSSSGVRERFESSLRGHSFGITRAVRRAGLSVVGEHALLSTSRHENQRAFDVRSQEAHDWLLHGSNKTASTTPFVIARQISRLAQRAGILRQCYPRYLFVCRRQNAAGELSSPNGIVLAGKNRSTVLELEDNEIQRIRKVPNSSWQATVNENAQAALNTVPDSLADTVPTGESQETTFGPERIEQPVSGTPLDQTLEATPESVDRHLEAVFDWLIEFQRATCDRWVTKTPAEIERELTVEQVGLSNPPSVDRELEVPQVVTHGDLSGSNIYLRNQEVSYVIDWEFSKISANPIIDVGYLILQLIDAFGTNFNSSFKNYFINNMPIGKLLCSHLQNYSDQIGIDPHCIAVYLPLGYIHQTKTDLRYNRKSDVDWPTRVHSIWNFQEEVANRIV